MEPDDDFTCGHPQAGLFGLYVKHARKLDGICGPEATLFIPRLTQSPNSATIKTE